MSDPTEDVRRSMIPEMPDKAAAAIERGEQTWTTEQVRAEFEVLSFLAPFVFVRRRSDNVEGTLQFSHSPRIYFGFQPD